MDQGHRTAGCMLAGARINSRRKLVMLGFISSGFFANRFRVEFVGKGV